MGSTKKTKESLQNESTGTEVPAEQAERSEESKASLLKKVRLFGRQIKKGIVKGLCFIVTRFGKLQRETKGVMLVSSVIGVVLCIAVIVLGVRLNKVTNELKSVQALSMNLQEELTKTQAEQKEELLLSGKGFAQDRSAFEAMPTEALIPTATPISTETPLPTVTPIPTVIPRPEKYIVCVDAGHGDWDGGAVLRENGIEKRVEKDDNLRMALLFRDALKEYGIEVVMTRETDVFLELSERTDIANAANADALISFHRNSFNGEDDVSGIEFWIHSSRPEGADTLAQSMLDAVMQVGGMKNRGVKSGSMSSTKDNYAINRAANMTSMIVEFGFITSQSDNAAYDANGEAYAKEMAKAVYEWLEAAGQ